MKVHGYDIAPRLREILFMLMSAGVDWLLGRRLPAKRRLKRAHISLATLLVHVDREIMRDKLPPKKRARRK